MLRLTSHAVVLNKKDQDISHIQLVGVVGGNAVGMGVAGAVLLI